MGTHADAVYVIGSFNDWSHTTHPMEPDESGYWYLDVLTAMIGDEYRYRIVNGTHEYLRLDPYAKEVTSTVGNSVIHDPKFDWQCDAYQLPPINEMVIYELHLGTFFDLHNQETDHFAAASQKLDYLRKLE